MAIEALDTALDRIEQALTRLEQAAQARLTAPPPAPPSAEMAAELTELRSRHSRLKQTVTQELRQLDLLLAGLPQ